MSSKAIGVFDSGIGGLTVVKAIMDSLPSENIIYFGDIARIPYGTKSVAMINKFASQTVQFLLNKQVKAIVIACNTITAVAYDMVQRLAGDIPVIDVISAGCLSATHKTDYKKIGIIATPATINSNAYALQIAQLNSKIDVVSQACPLLVPLIEEGLLKHAALELIAADYLMPLKQQKINALILGCTHYPLIADTLSSIIGNTIDIINPAIMTGKQLLDALTKYKLLNISTEKATNHQFYVTDNPIRFKQMGEMFLNLQLPRIELVSLGD